jgi:plastocyanin
MKVVLALAAMATLGGVAGCTSQQATSAPVQTDTITIPGQWVFEPGAIQVAAGTTVTWQDHGGQDHTVTFDDGSFDQVVHAGSSLARAFATPGLYAYHCKFHPPNMKGTILVLAGPANATGNATNRTS